MIYTCNKDTRNRDKKKEIQTSNWSANCDSVLKILPFIPSVTNSSRLKKDINNTQLSNQLSSQTRELNERREEYVKMITYLVFTCTYHGNVLTTESTEKLNALTTENQLHTQVHHNWTCQQPNMKKKVFELGPSFNLATRNNSFPISYLEVWIEVFYVWPFMH